MHVAATSVDPSPSAALLFVDDEPPVFTAIERMLRKRMTHGT
jgi:hypothetical protein